MKHYILDNVRHNGRVFQCARRRFRLAADAALHAPTPATVVELFAVIPPVIPSRIDFQVLPLSTETDRHVIRTQQDGLMLIDPQTLNSDELKYVTINIYFLGQSCSSVFYPSVREDNRGNPWSAGIGAL